MLDNLVFPVSPWLLLCASSGYCASSLACWVLFCCLRGASAASDRFQVFVWLLSGIPMPPCEPSLNTHPSKVVLYSFWKGKCARVLTFLRASIAHSSITFDFCVGGVSLPCVVFLLFSSSQLGLGMSAPQHGERERGCPRDMFPLTGETSLGRLGTSVVPTIHRATTKECLREWERVCRLARRLLCVVHAPCMRVVPTSFLWHLMPCR